MRLSVIIPHYNRLEALTETLSSLASQTLHADSFEVIVVDDGSNAKVEPKVAELNPPFLCHVLTQAQKGAAAARNLGATKARGRILLFLDCDMIATPRLLVQHIASHEKHDRALVAGPREVWPRTAVDTVVALAEGGSGEQDPRLRRGRFTFQEALTCNLSVRAVEWQGLGGFDERFPPRSGYEDIDFAYRAWLSGAEILLNPEALAYHNHPITVWQRYAQERNYQQTVPLLLAKHPELRGQIEHLRDKEPIGWRDDGPKLVARKIGRRLLALPPLVRAMEGLVSYLVKRQASPRVLRFLYFKILGSYQLMGLREGIERYGW